MKITINQKIRLSFVAMMIAATCIAIMGYAQLSKQVSTMSTIVHELESNQDTLANRVVKDG